MLLFVSVGAAGPILGEAVDRISAALSGENVSADKRDATIRRSFVLSSDQAHALHPNYAGKHEKNHQVRGIFVRWQLDTSSAYNNIVRLSKATNERWYGHQTQCKPKIRHKWFNGSNYERGCKARIIATNSGVHRSTGLRLWVYNRTFD